MSNTTLASALKNASKDELLALIAKLAEGEVAQAPEVEAKPKCSAVASSTGQRCTRNATQGDTCKSHVGWDNDEALAKHAKAQEFVESRREAAKKKGKGKKVSVDNKALAALLREQGLQPNGQPWARAKELVSEGVPMELAARTVKSELA